MMKYMCKDFSFNFLFKSGNLLFFLDWIGKNDAIDERFRRQVKATAELIRDLSYS